MTRSVAKCANANARKIAKRIDRNTLQNECDRLESGRFAADTAKLLVGRRLPHLVGSAVNWPYLAELFNAKERGCKRPRAAFSGRATIGVPPEWHQVFRAEPTRRRDQPFGMEG